MDVYEPVSSVRPLSRERMLCLGVSEGLVCSAAMISLGMAFFQSLKENDSVGNGVKIGFGAVLICIGVSALACTAGFVGSAVKDCFKKKSYVPIPDTTQKA